MHSVINKAKIINKQFAKLISPELLLKINTSQQILLVRRRIKSGHSK